MFKKQQQQQKSSSLRLVRERERDVYRITPLTYPHPTPFSTPNAETLSCWPHHSLLIGKDLSAIMVDSFCHARDLVASCGWLLRDWSVNCYMACFDKNSQKAATAWPKQSKGFLYLTQTVKRAVSTWPKQSKGLSLWCKQSKGLSLPDANSQKGCLYLTQTVKRAVAWPKQSKGLSLWRKQSKGLSLPDPNSQKGCLYLTQTAKRLSSSVSNV